MKHKILALAVMAVASASAADTITEITPYVYPENACATPGEMQFMPDGETFLRASDDHKRIVSYNTRTGEEIATIFDASHTRETSIAAFESFSISPDGTKLLIYTDRQSIYRHSFTAVYYTFDIKRNILKPLSTDQKRQQMPVFSPDGRSVAFVADNNIYIHKLDYDSQVRVTEDGAFGTIINGVPDWVYEEEFATTCSMEWAPDSETICFLSYNETDVPSYSLTLYEGACNPQKQYALYPGAYTYKYPVAGKLNSVVTLKSYDLSTRKTKTITFDDPNIEYIPRIQFTSDPNALLVVTLNRDQNRMEIYNVNPRSTVSHSLLVEESKAWIPTQAYENLVVTPKSLILTSARTGYKHLYEYTFNGSLKRTLTSGSYDVTQCYGVDAAGNVYYQAADRSPLERSVLCLDPKGKVTRLGNDAPGTNSAAFSPRCNYAVMQFSNSVTPPCYTLCTASGKALRVLEDNAAMKQFAANLPAKEFLTIPSDGYELNAYIIKPAGFTPSKRYPVIMWQYSGPGSQEVLNRWSLDWQQYAAASGEFIVVCVDPRGTGARGRDFETCVYRNLGYFETIDQINAARHIASLPYVDASRIGISGWSYGGYETLMCVGANNSPFAAAVAIAPVTDWRYYDTVYAERYMLTPQANEDGYNDSAPINRAGRVNCPLLVMYGTADDNVHPANTVEYVSRLISFGKYCDMFIFPNMNHSINYCGARAVVYGRMLDYFRSHL